MTGTGLLGSQTLAFIAVAALLTVAPGPDTMLVLRNVLRGGRRDGVATTLGVCSGCLVHATLSALGVSMILLHSATLFHALKGLGGSYLVWLGLQSLFKAARPSAAGPGSVDDGTARHPHRRSRSPCCSRRSTSQWASSGSGRCPPSSIARVACS